MHTNQPTTRAMERSDYENATNLYLYECGLNDELSRVFKLMITTSISDILSIILKTRSSDENFISFWVNFFTCYRMVDTNGDGDVGKLQVIKYIETRTHIDKPDYIERANEYFDQEMSIKNIATRNRIVCVLVDLNPRSPHF